MSFSWLCCYACTGIAEYRDFFDKVLPIIRKYLTEGTIDLHLVAYYVQGNGNIKGCIEIVDKEFHFDCPYQHINEALSDLFQKRKYDGFVYSGHSSGYVFGRNVKPTFHLTDLCNWLSGQQLKIIIFDSCYCGTIECLYELHGAAKYAITTPTYHEESILVVPDFYSFQPPLLDYMSNILYNFAIYGNKKYSLRLNVVDLDELPHLVCFLREHWNQLCWNVMGSFIQPIRYYITFAVWLVD